MVDGFFSAQNDVVRSLASLFRDEGGHLHGIHGIGIDANGIVGANGQRLSDHWITIGLAHRQRGDGASVLFFQFQSTHQRIPFVVRVDNELDAIRVKLGVALCEGNPARGVRGFADANEKLHGHGYESICQKCIPNKGTQGTTKVGQQGRFNAGN